MSNHPKGSIWPWKDRGVRDLEPLFAQKNITFLSTQLHALRLFSKINKTKLYLILYLFPLNIIHTLIHSDSLYPSVYLCVFVCLFMCIYLSIYMFTYLSIYTLMYLFIYICPSYFFVPKNLEWLYSATKNNVTQILTNLCYAESIYYLLLSVWISSFCFKDLQ